MLIQVFINKELNWYELVIMNKFVTLGDILDANTIPNLRFSPPPYVIQNAA